MKDNALIIVLAVIIVVLSCLLLGNVVSVSLAPVNASMGEMRAVQREILQRLESGKNDIKEQLANLDRRLFSIEAKQNVQAGALNAPPNRQGGGCGGAAGPGPDYNKVQNIPIGDSPILGPKNAPITIAAFLDIQCPFCARFYPPLKEVLKVYPDKVKVVVKNYPLPFHPNALPAAKLALAAGSQGKYFEMLEILLQNGAAATDDKIKEYAKTIGLNYDRLMADYKNKDAQWQKLVDADKALANQAGVQGTPTFFINGRLTSARDLAGYKTEIDKILSAKSE